MCLASDDDFITGDVKAAERRDGTGWHD